MCDSCGDSYDNQEEFHAHITEAHADHYCTKCNISFSNANELRMHLLRSEAHNERKFRCPGRNCNTSYITRSDLVLHLEYGSCCSGIERHRLNRFIARVKLSDRHDIIIEHDPVYDGDTSDVTEEDLSDTKWGNRFVCPKPGCHKSCPTVDGLRAHLNSPAHSPDFYRCPPRFGGCDKQFKAFSGLLSHLENGRCGAEKYLKVYAVPNIFHQVIMRVKSFVSRS